MIDDPSYEDCLAALSRPANDPGLSRRRFLQGAAAAAASAAILPSFRGVAGAATLGATEGVLVTVLLGGGNDGLNVLVPYGNARYAQLRRNIAIPTDQVLAIDGTYGLHPALPKLKSRYDTGKVAVVRGVGQPADDLSHFTSMATFMAGTASFSRSSGWLGRWADGIADSPNGLRVVTSGSSVPLHLVGSRAAVTALSGDGDMFGANTTEAWEIAAQDAAASFASQTTGIGAWADRFAAAGRAAIGTARLVSPVFTPDPPAGELTSQLVVAARLINANLGIRVLNTSLGSFDTHDNQPYEHGQLLAELDNAIDAFFAALAPQYADQVTLLTFSEFGRRPEANGSSGTDHGTASTWFVVGDYVRGGMHGDMPSLAATDLDSRGNLRRTVDFRSVYATAITGWLGGDATAVLGGSFPTLDLFVHPPGWTAPAPGPVVVPPPPGPTGPAAPFASWEQLVQQQYLDILGRPADGPGTAYWVGRLSSGSLSPAGLVNQFLLSREFGEVVAPLVRLYWAYFRRDPDLGGLFWWTDQLRMGVGLGTVSDAFARSDEFAQTYGSLADGAFVDLVYRNVLGRDPDAAGWAYWVGELAAGRITRGLVMIGFSESAENRDSTAADVLVLMAYAAMLRRMPDPAGRAYWTDLVRQGVSAEGLVAGIFSSEEYAARFTPR